MYNAWNMLNTEKLYTATKHNTNSVHNTEIMIIAVTVTTTTIKQQQNNDTDASVASGQKSVQ